MKLPLLRNRLHLKFPTYPKEWEEEAWLPRLPSILDRFVGFIDKIRHIGTIFTFSSGVSVVSRLEKRPHKRFAYRHALEPDYSAYGGHFLRARVCSLFYGLSSFDRFLRGDSRRRNADICAFNVAEGGRRIQ